MVPAPSRRPIEDDVDDAAVTAVASDNRCPAWPTAAGSDGVGDWAACDGGAAGSGSAAAAVDDVVGGTAAVMSCKLAATACCDSDR
jgi:hypothetical protein